MYKSLVFGDEFLAHLKSHQRAFYGLICYVTIALLRLYDILFVQVLKKRLKSNIWAQKYWDYNNLRELFWLIYEVEIVTKNFVATLKWALVKGILNDSLKLIFRSFLKVPLKLGSPNSVLGVRGPAELSPNPN